jgi:hypothetical protein
MWCQQRTRVAMNDVVLVEAFRATKLINISAFKLGILTEVLRNFLSTPQSQTSAQLSQNIHHRVLR